MPWQPVQAVPPGSGGLTLRAGDIRTALAAKTALLVASVEALCVDLIEPLPAACQVGLGGFDEQVVVIVHQAVGLGACRT